MSRRPILVAFLLAGGLAAVASASACGDLKSASEDAPDAGVEGGGTDAGALDGDGDADLVEGGSGPRDADADAGASTDSGNRGPGPHGSLPSGYCCNDDSECRYRRCVDATASGGVGKMCLDECFTQIFCTRPDITFSCSQPDAGERGLCRPPAGFACIPADEFVRGSLAVGACCNAGSASTNDGTAGSACEGNQCAATGAGPLVCTNRCAFQAECPAGFTCTLFGTSNACVPTTDGYTCN